MKICTICNQSKNHTEYHKSSKARDGHDGRCKLFKHENTIANRKTKAAADKERYALNKPAIQDWSRTYYLQNKSTKLKATRIWQDNNKEKIAAYKKNNKYKRREIVNSSNLKGADLRYWESTQVRICTYCGTTYSSKYEIDHIEPLSKGGTHELANLTLSCKRCNNSKSNRPLLLWLALKTTNY